MRLDTLSNQPINPELIQNYFDILVNRFFKILPIREQNAKSLNVYLESFKAELLGCQNLIAELQNDALFLSLLSILQYLIDNPECSVKSLRRQVFNAISICNKLKTTHITK